MEYLFVQNDTKKLFELTGFKAQIKLEQALPEMFKWYDLKYKEREKLS